MFCEYVRQIKNDDDPIKNIKGRKTRWFLKKHCLMEALSSKHPHFYDHICFLLNPVCFLFEFWLLPLCFLLRCLLGHRGRGLGHASGLLAGACLWQANEAPAKRAMPWWCIFDAQGAAWREACDSKADAAIPPPYRP